MCCFTSSNPRNGWFPRHGARNGRTSWRSKSWMPGDERWQVRPKWWPNHRKMKISPTEIWRFGGVQNWFLVAKLTCNFVKINIVSLTSYMRYWFSSWAPSQSHPTRIPTKEVWHCVFLCQGATCALLLFSVIQDDGCINGWLKMILCKWRYFFVYDCIYLFFPCLFLYGLNYEPSCVTVWVCQMALLRFFVWNRCGTPLCTYGFSILEFQGTLLCW